MSTNALVVVGQQLPAESKGLEGFSLKPAVMKLVQKTTTDPGAIPGKLLDTLSGQHFDSVRVVPLAVRAGRVYFPPSGELGSEPICRSDDNIVPSPGAKVPQSPTCATCEHGPKLWKTYKQTKKAPDCKEKFNMLFVTRDAGLPYYISIGGSSISQLKKLKDAIYRDVLVAKSKGETRSLFDYSFELKPVAVQGKKGNFYVLSFANLEKIANPGEFGPIYEQFVANAKAFAEDAETQEILDKAVGEEPISGEYVEA